MKNQRIHRPYTVLTLGVSVCLVGAFLMVAGESILGTDHTGIATIVGIVGIGIIAHRARDSAF